MLVYSYPKFPQCNSKARTTQKHEILGRIPPDCRRTSEYVHWIVKCQSACHPRSHLLLRRICRGTATALSSASSRAQSPRNGPPRLAVYYLLTEACKSLVYLVFTVSSGFTCEGLSRISCQKSGISCLCTFRRVGTDRCSPFVYLLSAMHLLGHLGTDALSVFLSNFHVSIIHLQVQVSPKSMHLSVSIQKISHFLFPSASVNAKLSARALLSKHLGVSVNTFPLYTCRPTAFFFLLS